MKKLIPAVVMLLVSAVVLSTASYAWFTMSTNVTAEGMKVTASAPTSVLISEVVAGDSTLGYGYTGWSSSINFQTADGANKLYAATTTDGVNFYAPKECTDVDGAPVTGTPFTAATAAGNTKYYVDYTFAIKNTSPDADVYLEIASVTLNGYALKDAVRFAIFTNTSYGATPANATALYNPGSDSWIAGAQGPVGEAIPENDEDWADLAAGTLAANVYEDYSTDIIVLPKAVQAESEEVGSGEDATTSVSSQAADNAQIITIRIWFEGQSAACISAYAGQNVSLSIQFKVGEQDTTAEG